MNEQTVAKVWVECKGAGAVNVWIEGAIVEGVFAGWKVGKFGHLALLSVRGELQTYSAPAILRDRLQGIAEGTPIRIECLGKITLKNGNEAWDFKVHKQRAGDEPALPSDAEINAAQVEGDDVDAPAFH
jgi:hypothetical protein